MKEIRVVSCFWFWQSRPCQNQTCHVRTFHHPLFRLELGWQITIFILREVKFGEFRLNSFLSLSFLVFIVFQVPCRVFLSFVGTMSSILFWFSLKLYQRGYSSIEVERPRLTQSTRMGPWICTGSLRNLPKNLFRRPLSITHFHTVFLMVKTEWNLGWWDMVTWQVWLWQGRFSRNQKGWYNMILFLGDMI